MTTNAILTILVAVATVGGVVFWYIKSATEKRELDISEIPTIESLLEHIKYRMADLVRDSSFSGYSDEEYAAMRQRKADIKNALIDCVYGIDKAKAVVLDLIETEISEKLPNEVMTDQVIDFDSDFLEPEIKFEILMYVLKPRYGKKSLKYLIDTYNITQRRYVTIEETKEEVEQPYFWSTDELSRMYSDIVQKGSLEYIDKIRIIAILIYQKYRGFGKIDTLREMDIDGFEIGTSGSVLANLTQMETQLKRSRSVWVYYEGKFIHLRFIDFGTEYECRRVINLIARYKSPGTLDEDRGYLINSMYDKSRVLAMRTPLSSHWAVFVRKFVLHKPNIKKLLCNMKPFDQAPVKNWELAYSLMRMIIEAEQTIAFTGRQGSGKSTMMAACGEYINPHYNIRIGETTPELWFEELYPEKNVVAASETRTVPFEEIQDAFKKSDAAVMIVGEVATNMMAAKMIQAAQIASIFTWFSHHANTAKDLVAGLANSLKAAGSFDDSKVAEQQVLDVIHLNFHFDYDAVTGVRFLDRVTEIIPVASKRTYPELTGNSSSDLAATFREFASRTTDPITFVTNDILRFNRDTSTYEAVNWFSNNMATVLASKFTPERRYELARWATENWDIASTIKGFDPKKNVGA